MLNPHQNSILPRLGLFTLTTVSIALLTSRPSQAQSCQPLPVVAGEGTEVEKSISAPSIGVYRNNWDTDFSAENATASQYLANITAQDGGEYSIEMYLKYADGSADEIYNQSVGFEPGESLNISGVPRLDEQPYQVNLSVGGLTAVGNHYNATVSACP